MVRAALTLGRYPEVFVPGTFLLPQFEGATRSPRAGGDVPVEAGGVENYHPMYGALCLGSVWLK